MSLNDIQIPPALLAELYGDTMIIEEKINAGLIPATPNNAGTTALEKEEIKESPIKNFLGDNLRNILVVVSYPSLPVISDEDLKFLTGILAACKLGLADVVIVNIADVKNNWSDLKKAYNPKQVLLFGVDQEAFDLPVRFPEFQVQAISVQQFLSSPALAVIKEDKLIKAKLWASLQKLFNL